MRCMHLKGAGGGRLYCWLPSPQVWCQAHPACMAPLIAFTSLLHAGTRYVSNKLNVLKKAAREGRMRPLDVWRKWCPDLNAPIPWFLVSLLQAPVAAHQSMTNILLILTVIQGQGRLKNVVSVDAVTTICCLCLVHAHAFTRFSHCHATRNIACPDMPHRHWLLCGAFLGLSASALETMLSVRQGRNRFSLW